MSVAKFPLVAFACCAAAPCAVAVELPEVVGLHLVSVHAQDGKAAEGSRGWNNNNLGLYGQWANGFTAGMYRNSLYRESYYVGWTFGSAFALTVGLVSGYDKVVRTGGDYTAVRCQSVCRTVNLKEVIAPLVVPSVRLPLPAGLARNTFVRLSVMKAPQAPAALHLSIEWRFR